MKYYLNITLSAKLKKIVRLLNGKGGAMHFFLVFLFLISNTFAETYKGFDVLSRDKSIPVVLVPTEKLCPTQVAIGQFTVSALLKERFGEKLFSDLKFSWDKNKSLEENLKTLKESELQDYVASIQKKMLKKIGRAHV